MRRLLPLLAVCLLLGFRCDRMLILYTHTADVGSWEWALGWYVEDATGLQGPLTSGGTGVVVSEPVGGDRVHVSRRLAGFVWTWMDVPTRGIDFYTGDMDGAFPDGDVTVVLENAPVGDELMLFYPFPSWWDLDQSPWSLTQSFAGEDVIGNDGKVSVLLSVRSGPGEEPSSRYDFRVDVDPSELSDVRFDAAELRERPLVRGWQSSVDLSGGAEPYLVARRQGVFQLAGESATELAGTSGSFGIPSDFPAQRWYLFSGSMAAPEIVRAVDPASAAPTPLEPLAGLLDDESLDFDPATRTVSASAPGLGEVHFGRVLLAHTGGYWELCFPGGALARDGDALSLALPVHPGGPLPSFASIHLDLYRLDEGADYEDMLRFTWHHRRFALPSYAMQSAFRFLP